MRLDLIVMRVSDWAAAVDWYSGVLGLEILHREDDHRFCMLGFPSGETKLAIHHQDSGTAGQSRCIPNILVEDLAAAVDRLQQKGVKFLGPIRGGDEGYRVISLHDPEGNELQLYEWVAHGGEG